MTLLEFLGTASQVSRKGTSGWLGGTRFAILVFVLQLPFSLSGQNITSISGFRPSAEVDPLAEKDVLEVMAMPTRLAGVDSRIEATVTVACKEHVPNALLTVLSTLLERSVLGQSRPRAALGFTVGISGANLDVQTENVTHSDYSPIIGAGIYSGVTTHYSTQERLVIVKMRFDEDNTIQNAAPSTEPHQVSFSYFDIARASRARRLILGLSSSGRPIYLQLNLTESVLRSLIRQCAAIDQRYEAEAEVKMAEEKKQQEAPSAPDSVRCHDSLNRLVPVQKVLREDAFRWCGITPQRWDELNGKRSPLPPKQVAATNGVTWMNGDPTFIDGNTNTTVKLSKSFILIQQGVASAKFSITPQGTGIQLTPPNARRREMYNTQNHNYANTDPNNGDKTGDYPGGPPPGMMSNLAPFVQVAVKAIDRAKQTPDGANWDDQYFRNILKPYDTLSASNPR
jgi:hypothetical protein